MSSLRHNLREFGFGVTGGYRPFGSFLKIHTFWWGNDSLKIDNWIYVLTGIQTTSQNSEPWKEDSSRRWPLSMSGNESWPIFLLTKNVADMFAKFFQCWQVDCSRSSGARSRKTFPVQLLWTRFCAAANTGQACEDAHWWKTVQVSCQTYDCCI